MPTVEPNASADHADLPHTVGRYGVVRRIGRGGFAEVYLARDPETGAFLALKVLREDLDPGIRDQVRARFLAEEAIARAIDHPAVVRIRETSARGERPCFIAMDYVDGLPFCEYFERRRAPDAEGKRRPRLAYYAEVARVGYEVAKAIAVAHERGIVHRDLKPDNVLVVVEAGTAHARLLDFGIAKAPLELFSADRSAPVTRYHTELGTVMGSPPYMAPEQNGTAHGVSGKADVFALGVMLLVVLLGLDARALELGEERVVLPADFDALVRGAAFPERLRALLRAMLDADPDDRPDMNEVAIVLQRVAQIDEKFGAAVEAWIRRGEVPRARTLFELSSNAELTTSLTDDERAFLQRAPLERLRRARVRAAWALAGCGSLGALGALGLFAVPLAGTGSGVLEAFSSLRRPAPAASVVDRVFAASPASDLRSQTRALETTLSDQKRLLDEQTRRGNEQQDEIRALKSELAELKRGRDQAQQKVSVLESRVAGGERALGECRAEAERHGQALIECRRDMEAHLSQLAEGAERLRLCTRSLREQTERGRGRVKATGNQERLRRTAPAEDDAVRAPESPDPIGGGLPGEESRLLD